MRTVSVVVIIKDEEHLLRYTMPCFASLTPLLKEVIYIDDCSTDNSERVAHNIASKFKHFPLIWIKHKMERWDEQRNIGLERATGDFIISLDADMSFTGNMRWKLEGDEFDSHDVWDFKIHVCKPDPYHYDKQTASGFNWTTRVIKNSGIRYVGAAHEQPDRYLAESKTDIEAVRSEDLPKKGFCTDVWMFELSPLSPDYVLRKRAIRLERFRKEMTDRGIPPPHPDRYINFKHNGSDVLEVPDKIREQIVTLPDALKHWGK